MRNGMWSSRDAATAARRRSWPAIAVLGVLVGGLLAGCARTDLDGDVTDDWAAMAAPKVFQPAAATCHATPASRTVAATAYDPVDCAEAHRSETIHVGTFRGDAGSASAPPEDDTPAIRAAYTECEQAAKDFLGDDWRTGRVYLSVTLPTGSAWGGGARWFRCDLAEVRGKDDQSPVTRTGSLKDALRGGRGPLRYGCYQVTSRNDRVESMKPVPCTQAHNAEFVGVHVPPDAPYTRLTDARWSAYHTACRSLIARYIGVSVNTARRAGSVASPLGEDEWRRGNRGVLCHVWFEDKNLRKSVKGAGALPD
ncbi:MAG TPA: septum formation family protein [Pilimelia sp.]|nr:septum formation family protein [Pilimelia sp.]